jgi:hypothetical protein
MGIRIRNTIDPVVSNAQSAWPKAAAIAERYPVEESM